MKFQTHLLYSNGADTILRFELWPFFWVPRSVIEKIWNARLCRLLSINILWSSKSMASIVRALIKYCFKYWHPFLGHVIGNRETWFEQLCGLMSHIILLSFRSVNIEERNAIWFLEGAPLGENRKIWLDWLCALTAHNIQPSFRLIRSTRTYEKQFVVLRGAPLQRLQAKIEKSDPNNCADWCLVPS